MKDDRFYRVSSWTTAAQGFLWGLRRFPEHAMVGAGYAFGVCLGISAGCFLLDIPAVFHAYVQLFSLSR